VSRDRLVIETPRLRLRVPTPEDATRYLAYVTDNREHFAPWDPERDASYYTVEHWRRQLDRVVAAWRAGTQLSLVLEARDGSTDRLLGHVTFSQIVRGPFQAATLGYALDHREVGRGLMAEALGAAIDFVFSELGLHRVQANYMPTNVRSGELLRRLGFVPEGYARDYLRLAGAWRDHVLTARTNPHWTPDQQG